MAPTILIVPGAWHTADTFSLLAQSLENLGYPVVVAQLSSVGSTTATVSDDTAALAKVLNPLLAEKTEIVFVAHSYASFPSSALLQSASRQRRQNYGKAGGIIGTIFLAAFIPREGATLIEMVGGKPPPWWKVNVDSNLITVPDPCNSFYHDVPEEIANRTIAMIKHQSLRSFYSPAGPAGWRDSAYDGRRAYVTTERDQALPYFVQKAMLEESGVEWELIHMKTAHSAFLSNFDEVATYVTDLAGRWVK